MVKSRYMLTLMMLAGILAFPTYAQQSGTFDSFTTQSVRGVVIAARSWDVSAVTNGRITHLHFIEGEVVREGDLLVEFDETLRKLEVELAEAAVGMARTNLEKDTEVLERLELLVDRKAVSLTIYRNAYFAAETANEELRTAEVRLKMANAVLKAQKLYAPYDGRISAPHYRENANVDTIAGTEIATIVQLDPIHVRAPILAERVLHRLRTGEFETGLADRVRVELKFSGELVYQHPGHIVSMGFDINPETGEGSVLISFPNPEGLLRPGLNVTVTGYGN